MVEDEHNYNGCYDRNEVPNDDREEVVFRWTVSNSDNVIMESASLLLSLALALNDWLKSIEFKVLKHIEAETQGHEDAWDDDISEAENRVLRRGCWKVSWELQFDRSINVLSDCNHDICAEDKENVVEKEERQKEGSSLEVTHEDELEGVDAEDHC